MSTSATRSHAEAIQRVVPARGGSRSRRVAVQLPSGRARELGVVAVERVRREQAA